MIEHLFVTTGQDGAVAFTAMGERHAGVTQAYGRLMNRLVPALAEDCVQFAPAPGAYSPYAVLYGFSSNLLEHMTMKALQPEAEHRFSLEDVFVDAGPGADKLAWVSGWRRLPHMSQEIQKLYEYPQQFAEVIFGRITAALQVQLSGAGREPGHTGRLWIATAAEGSPRGSSAPPLQGGYLFSSDSEWVASRMATPREEARLLAERNEGEFLVSFRTPRGWTAITKDVLTDVLGNGRDAAIRDLPTAAAQVLKLMYPQLVAA
jgi:hypothetical protein